MSSEKNFSLRAFATSTETIEILIAHALIVLLSLSVYIIEGATAAVIVFGVGMLVELLAFHVLWIYRDNKARDYPILYAIGVEILNIGVAVVALVIVFALALGLYKVAGIPPFHTISIGAVLGLVWLVHRSVKRVRSADN